MILVPEEVELIAFYLKTTPAYLMGWEEKKNEAFTEFEKELISRCRAADNITHEIVKRALELDKALKKWMMFKVIDGGLKWKK